MITKWYKNLIKYMLLATTTSTAYQYNNFPSNLIKDTGGNNIDVTRLNFGYNSSYVGFPTYVNYSLATTDGYPGFGFQRTDTDMVESETNYKLSNYFPSSSYLTINSIKAVKRYDAETNSPCIDYHLELKWTSTSPVTLAGVGFLQFVGLGNNPNSETSQTRRLVLFDYTEFPEPVTLTNLKNEVIVYTLKTTWDFEEEEPEP